MPGDIRDGRQYLNCIDCGQEFGRLRGSCQRLCPDCRREKKQDIYLPTPDEIAEAAAEIRKTWTGTEHAARESCTFVKKVYKAH